MGARGGECKSAWLHGREDQYVLFQSCMSQFTSSVGAKGFVFFTLKIANWDAGDECDLTYNYVNKVFDGTLRRVSNRAPSIECVRNVSC